MSKKAGINTNLILTIIFALVIGALFIFKLITLPSEFYASFAGALAALVFSVIVSFYAWKKASKQSKDTKAQIVQTLLSEVELNLGNIAIFIKGCREATYFHPYVAGVMQKNLFWPRFLTDSPHPSFEFTQHFDLLYGSFFLMDFYAKEMQFSLPENLRFYPSSAPPLPMHEQDIIRSTSQQHLSKWKFAVKNAIEYYDKIATELSAEFKGYTFRKQMYFEQNNIYEKLRRFSIEM